MPDLHMGKPHKKTGGHGAPEYEVPSEDRQVPKADLLVPDDPNSTAAFKHLMDTFAPKRYGNAAIGVDLAHDAYDSWNSRASSG